MNEETQEAKGLIPQNKEPAKLVEGLVGEPVLDSNERPAETEQPHP